MAAPFYILVLLLSIILDYNKAVCNQTEAMTMNNTMENITQASEPTELPISDTSLITERTTPLYCKTGKGLSGECVERKRCDFSTSNIDFTLYRPHRKPRPCEPKEVCCPFDFVLPLAPPSYEEEIIDFDNDD